MKEFLLDSVQWAARLIHHRFVNVSATSKHFNQCHYQN